MKRKNNSFLEMLERYINVYLPVSKGLSERTIVSYKAVFRILFEFMRDEKGVAAIDISFKMFTADIISEFLDWLEETRNCSVSTRNHRLSVLNAFAEYAQNRDFSEATGFRTCVTSVPRKKGTMAKRSFFTRDETKKLLEAPSCKTEIGIRDRTLLCIMYASGMRAQEVCDLRVRDIQFTADKANISILGKGRKYRRIAIPKPVADMLIAYLKHRCILDKPERHVFSSQTHEQMTVSCIEEIYSKYVRKLRSENPSMFREKTYTPHSMRHTTAVHMLEAEVPLIVLKNFLGHTSLQTTQIYAEISQETMNRQLEEWNKKWFIKTELQNIENNNNEIPGFLM